jgi:hypothetical protein
MDLRGELDVGGPAVGLEGLKDLAVDRVDVVPHAGY